VVNQGFSQFPPVCGPLLGYSLIIGVNVFSHERIPRTVSGMKLVYTNKGKSGIISKEEIFSRNDESTDIQARPGTHCGRIDGFFFLDS